jgi:hypothetical protein
VADLVRIGGRPVGRLGGQFPNSYSLKHALAGGDIEDVQQRHPGIESGQQMSAEEWSEIRAMADALTTGKPGYTREDAIDYLKNTSTDERLMKSGRPVSVVLDANERRRQNMKGGGWGRFQRSLLNVKGGGKNRGMKQAATVLGKAIRESNLERQREKYLASHPTVRPSGLPREGVHVQGGVGRPEENPELASEVMNTLAGPGLRELLSGVAPEQDLYPEGRYANLPLGARR